MVRRQAFKFQLRPNGTHHQAMCRFAGTCRYVFKKALATQKSNYAKGIKFHSYNKMAAWLTSWRNDPELSWLKDGPSQSQEHARKNLENGFKKFFRKEGGFPKFKKKGDPESFRFPAGFQVDAANARIKLPKLSWIRYRKSREILGTPKNITVSRKAGQWFVSIQTELEIEISIPPRSGAIDVDLGASKFAALTEPPPNKFGGFLRGTTTKLCLALMFEV